MTGLSPFLTGWCRKNSGRLPAIKRAQLFEAAVTGIAHAFHGRAEGNRAQHDLFAFIGTETFKILHGHLVIAF